jgi:outer membrane protein
VAGLAAFAVPARGQVHKIAYLDSRRLLAEAPGAQDARDRIEQERTRFAAQVQVLQDSLDAMIADYQRKSVLLSPEEKKKQEDAIVQRRDALGQRVQGIQAQAEQRQNDLMAPVMNRIQEVIDSVRLEGGYSIIFDAAQGIVSADSTLDVTVNVLARLKTSAGAPSKRP